MIVAGNLAADRGSQVLRRVRGIDDLHEDLIQTGLARYFGPNRVADRWTHSDEGRFRRQLDHILVGPAVQALCGHKGIEARTVQTVVPPPEPSLGLSEEERGRERAAARKRANRGGPDPSVSDHARALVVTLRWRS